MKKPWYKNGLRFTCTQCGDCCTGEPGDVHVTDEDLQKIADFLGESFEVVYGVYSRASKRGRSLREKLNGDCVFYDRDQGCTVYEVRPPQCKTWPFWDSNLATPEDWKQTCEVCPGSGQGELISEEEITKRARVIHL